MSKRDPSAYLSDILEAAAAIQEATGSIDEATYTATRLIRSAVEREFTVIGEALKVIAQRNPELSLLFRKEGRSSTFGTCSPTNT